MKRRIVVSFAQDTFPRQHSVAPRDSKQFVKQLEDLSIRLLSAVASFQRGNQAMHQVLQDFGWRTANHRAESRAADGHQF